MAHHAHLKNHRKLKLLCQTQVPVPTNPGTQVEPTEIQKWKLESRPNRVWPDGEYREFSEDGCYVGPYFR
jgi:hypothetical protein